MILGGGEDYWYIKGNEGVYLDVLSEDKIEGSKGM